jgi:type I restriction enzyme, S subunit
MVLRPGPNVLSEFIFYFLSQSAFLNAGAAVMTGAVGHKRVPKDFVEAFEIPVPPLPEQQRIVAILDEAFEGIATATANTEKNLANARELFKAYLAGQFNASEEWQTQPLGLLCENLDWKRRPITKCDRLPGGVPYYGASGAVDHVRDHLFDEPLLLVSEDGANLLMRTYPVAFSISRKSWVNNHAHVLRFESHEVRRFTEYYINSIHLNSYISGMAQPKLNQKALNSIPVPIPPGNSAGEFVHRLDTMAEQSELLRHQYDRKLTALAELKQSLLARAFSGELTARDALAA